MQVCEAFSSNPSMLFSCRVVTTPSPGPDCVYLPPGSNIFVGMTAKICPYLSDTHIF